jgi:hypothetical protein
MNSCCLCFDCGSQSSSRGAGGSRESARDVGLDTWKKQTEDIPFLRVLTLALGYRDV